MAVVVADVLITIDTELSAGLHQRGFDAAANHAASIEGRTADGAVGIGWLMDQLDAHGLTGVFFVDPMPALVHGPGILPPIVAPILARGHEAQLHVHTEWLAWATASPVGGRQGRNIGDFALDDQVTLLSVARDLLEEAGAPRPIAFSAGNYGADARTLEALARLGFRWDSSGGAFPGALPTDARHPDVAAAPVGGLYDRPGHVRPAQVCALSAREMAAALRHAAGEDAPFCIVTHSFEMLSRDRRRANRAVMARFDAMCGAIAGTPGLRSTGFAGLRPGGGPARMAPPNLFRTVGRMAEQAMAALRYEHA